MHFYFAITILTVHFAPLDGRQAYLDPGSGSFLLQLLIAGVLGTLVLLRSYWSRIKSLFRRSSPEDAEQEDEE